MLQLGRRLSSSSSILAPYSFLAQQPSTLSFSTSSSAGAAATAGPNSAASTIPEDGLTLSHFINISKHGVAGGTQLQSASSSTASGAPTVFLETYGCQMNVNDSEVVHSVLHNAGYTAAVSAEEADVVLLNTCAIRDNAESKIWQRLGYFKNMKIARKSAAKKALKAQAAFMEQPTSPPPPVAAAGPIVGVLGCMAERLKERLLESDKMVDIVVGPDAYRDLPRLIDIVDGGAIRSKASSSNGGSENEIKRPAHTAAAINVQLNVDETYADVVPLRPAGARSVFLSIMRGCNNMCAFCVVPFTRGRERSRPLQSILDEVRMLSDQGVKEVTLLGQNVNSYADFSHLNSTPRSPQATASPTSEDPYAAHYAKGFKSVYRPRRDGAVPFAELLDRVAAIDPEMRIRFTSPHPKDFSDDVLSVLRSRHNVCKQLHMPAQSGASSVLERMKRGYTREAYDDLVLHVRHALPGVALSTDMIAGFCGETEEEHSASVDLLKKVRYDLAFLFAYSEREKTHASRNYPDDVPEEVKVRRLQELIDVYRAGVYAAAEEEVGRRHIVLVEGPSRRSADQLTGRTDTFKRVVFEDALVASEYTQQKEGGVALVNLQPGDYVAVQVTEAGGGTLKAVPLARTTIKDFVELHKSCVPLEKFA